MYPQFCELLYVLKDKILSQQGDLKINLGVLGFLLLFCLLKLFFLSSSRTRTPASINATPANINLAGKELVPGTGGKRDGARRTVTSNMPISHLCVLTDLTRAVNALPQNMTSQVFSAIAAVTGQGQNPNATPAQWASSQYGYGGSGGGSSAYHVRGLGRKLPAEGGEG